MNPIQIHYFQHVPFEDPGFILDWIADRGYKVSSTRFFEASAFPNIRDFDWLVVMGGPMGVDEEERYPWLKEEKAFIKSAIDKNKTVIGICLGAQLIAASLGADVYRAAKKEIGWYPVSLTPEGSHCHLFKNFPETMPVFHWHGDTFDLPASSIHLMESAACTNQAFLYNNKVLGLQFHLEVTVATVTNMIENCRNELIPGDYVQNEETILKSSEKTPEINKWLEYILDHI